MRKKSSILSLSTFLSLIAFSLLSTFQSCRTVQSDRTPTNIHKREFRGAWIQVINGQVQGMGRDAMQANLTNQLNELQN